MIAYLKLKLFQYHTNFNYSFKSLHSNSGIESGSDAPKNQLSKVNSMRLILKKEKIESEME